MSAKLKSRLEISIIHSSINYISSESLFFLDFIYIQHILDLFNYYDKIAA